MHFHRIAGQFYNRPLLLTPHAADTISNFLLSRISDGPLAGRGSRGGEDTAQTSTTLFPAQVGGDGTLTVHTPQASRFYGETPLSEDGTRRPLPFRRTAEGVAILTLVGEWVNRGGYVGASSGVISYEGFKFQIESATRDPRTKAILLDMESPGGEAVGAFEAAAAVRAASAVKPVWALVNGLAASAMYAIASGASRIVSIPTGISGSIGVVLAHFDMSDFLKKEGIKPTFIHAGARKVDANPYQALPEAVRERLQGEVDDFYQMFVETVATGRPGLTEKAIRDTEAGTFMGGEALALGLVDVLGTFEQTLAEMSFLQGPAMSRPNSQGSSSMSAASTATSLAALAAAGAIPPVAPLAAGSTAAALPAAELTAAGPQASAEALAAARLEGFNAGKAEGLTEGKTAGASAERERIGAILNHEAATGRGKLAMHLAFNSDSTPDTAAGILGASAAQADDQATGFVAAKEGRTSLSLDPEKEAKGGSAAAETIDWSAIAAEQNAKLPGKR